MKVTATKAKGRLGPVLGQAPPPASGSDVATRFGVKYKGWVAEQNRHFEKYGVFGEAFRLW